jgi:hypothetical protein
MSKRQTTITRARELARTGKYTIAEIAFHCRISHHYASKLTKDIEPRRVQPIKSYTKVEKPQTVFEAILSRGHDEDFEGRITPDFVPTSTLPGSSAKVEVLRRRVELGQPLWHRDDRASYDGIGIGGKVPVTRLLSLCRDTGPGIRVCRMPMSGGKTLS